MVSWFVFTTFRHRTLFCHNRKKLKNQSIRLDLTKSRLSLLNNARKLIENNDDIAFCYADINCRCKLRFKNNNEFFFTSLAMKQIIWLFKQFKRVSSCCQCSHIISNEANYLAIQTIQTSEFVLSMLTHH